MTTEYKMSFWNYQKIGKKDIKQSVNDWKSMGFNYPISFRYDSKSSNKNEMLEFLDECHKLELKVFLDDPRLYYGNYIHKGQENYRKDVQEVVKDFGSHPAVYGFLLGDEPNRENMDEVVPKVFGIVREYAPNLNCYMNFLPYWGDRDDGFINAFKIKALSQRPVDF